MSEIGRASGCLNGGALSSFLLEIEVEFVYLKPIWGSVCARSHLAIPWAAAVLVGDAAHAIQPTLGQGTSAALESVAVLDKVLIC